MTRSFERELNALRAPQRCRAVISLTPRQSDLLAFLATEQRAGRSPSYREIGAVIGVSSTQNVARYIDALAERGCIHRLQNRARSIEVIARAPDGAPLRFVPVHAGGAA